MEFWNLVFTQYDQSVSRDGGSILRQAAEAEQYRHGAWGSIGMAAILQDVHRNRSSKPTSSSR